MNLITVIPCHSKDCDRAEKLLDLMLFLQDKQPDGHGVLALAPDVPQENRDKLRITAELVFSSLEVFNVKEMPEVGDQKETKSLFVDAMFEAVARRMNTAYKDPWLWLEPDTVPMKKGWKNYLAASYDSQPKRYMGGRMKAGESQFLTLLCVFPCDTLRDMEAAWSANMPFRFYAFDLSNKTPLVQNLPIISDADAEKVRSDALLVHGDKAGILIPRVMESAQRPKMDQIFQVESVPSTTEELVAPPSEALKEIKRIIRKPKKQPELATT